MRMKRFFDFFKKKEIGEETPVEIPADDIIFNVDNFNDWFNDPNNGAVYAHTGIFLRLDKLSENHIMDYLEKKYGIKNGGPFVWTNTCYEKVTKFYEEIRKDWRNKLN